MIHIALILKQLNNEYNYSYAEELSTLKILTKKLYFKITTVILPYHLLITRIAQVGYNH